MINFYHINSMLFIAVCISFKKIVVYCSLEHLAALQSQFYFDPLLPRLLVKKATVRDLSSLVGRVSLSVILMRLAQEYNTSWTKVR